MTVAVPTSVVTTSAPGKVILFGEHAVNRGELALAASFGRRAMCRVETTGDERITLRGAGREAAWSKAELRRQTAALDAALAAADYAAIAAALRTGFFTSSAYLIGRIASAGTPLPGLTVTFASDLPIGGGLGSGGAVHVALALALGRLLRESGGGEVAPAEIGAWAFAGDRIAHGGTASALDTQTSLLGGVIEFRAGAAGLPVAAAAGLRLVVGDTGIAKGSTGSVNSRIRDWLAADPSRLDYFKRMGALAVAAREPLMAGRWPELGALMDQNHALLSTIGASHPKLDALCTAARAAGAHGAKLTGAGGGGAMIALVSEHRAADVVAAIQAAGGTAIQAAVGGPGAAVESVAHP